ncbi:MAG: cytochrome b [Phyllobacteriaceae bacterium]|nr:cytochrome b [Phyllobacteriaceae bacterium]
MSAVSATTTAPRNWDAGVKTLHWSMAVFIVAAWVLVQLRVEHATEVADKAFNAQVMMAHKSVGLLVFALLLVRVAWRFTHAAPAAEKTPWEPLGTLAAKAGHGLLYLLMIAVPLGGIAATLVAGRPLPFFGLFEIASPFAQNHDLAETFGGVHELAGNALLFVAFAHAVVGIFHHAVLKDRTLLKMKPFARD